ncbi:MAG: hypothetical protein Q8L78_09310 [Coxiellaceae bacterium]|nr:hypothetical protein [Coxiellaceae bacterium]
MLKQIGLVVSALFFFVSIITCHVLNKKIDAGEKQLLVGQKQYDAGQKMLQAGEVRLKTGENKLSDAKGVYGTVNHTPVAIIKYMPVTNMIFKHVDHKIASGDRQVAEGKQKVKVGQAKLAAGKIALTEGKNKLEMAKKIVSWLEIVTGISSILFLLFGIFYLKECQLQKFK